MDESINSNDVFVYQKTPGYNDANFHGMDEAQLGDQPAFEAFVRCSIEFRGTRLAKIVTEGSTCWKDTAVRRGKKVPQMRESGGRKNTSTASSHLQQPLD